MENLVTKSPRLFPPSVKVTFKTRATTKKKILFRLGEKKKDKTIQTQIPAAAHFYSNGLAKEKMKA